MAILNLILELFFNFVFTLSIKIITIIYSYTLPYQGTISC